MRGIGGAGGGVLGGCWGCGCGLVGGGEAEGGVSILFFDGGELVFC